MNSLRIYIEKLKKGESIDRPLEKIKEERQNIISEYRGLVKTEEDKKRFDQLQRTSELVFPYVGNHMFYVEHWFHSIFWNKMRNVASILHDNKFIKDTEDVWVLNRHEIKQALWNVVISWGTGIKGYGSLHWAEVIEWRRRISEIQGMDHLYLLLGSRLKL